MLSLTRGIALLLTVGGVGYLLWRAPRFGTVRACAYALGLVVVLGPIVLPWYALWAVVVLAAAGDRRDRLFAVIATIVFLIVLQPSGSTMPDLMLMITVVLLTGVAVAIWCRPVRRSIENEWALIIDDYEHLGVAGSVHGTTRRLGERTRGLLPHKSRYRVGTGAVAKVRDSDW